MIQHVIRSLVEEPVVGTLFNDITLDEPILECVKAFKPFTATYHCYENNETICTFVGNPVYLQWNHVDDADWYIVQVCQNSQFVGPTLRTARVTEAASIAHVDRGGGEPIHEMEFFAGQDLSFGPEFWWRVFALNDEGGAGPKSEVWHFSFKCNDRTNNGGTNEDPPTTDCGCDTEDIEVVIGVECNEGTLTVTTQVIKALAVEEE